MMTLMKNLGKFCELYSIEKIQPGDPTEAGKGMLSYSKWGKESKKTSFEKWKVEEKATIGVFGYFLIDWISQKIYQNSRRT